MKNRKITALVVAILALIIGIMAAIFFFFGEKPSKGSKAITIEVVDDKGASKSYSVKTDAEFLRQAMEEAKGLEFSGSESAYGLMVETVNGVTADYNADGAYWSFYVNDSYCNYGVDSQPVADGDAFKIVYDKFVG